MCGPLAIGAGLALASVAANSAGSNKNTSARNDAMGAYKDQIGVLSRQAQETLDPLIASQGAGVQHSALGRAVQNRLNATLPAINGTMAALPTSGSAPAAVRDAYTGAVADEKSAIGGDIQHRGALDAQADLNFGNNIDLARGAQDLARIGNFAAGDSRLIGLQMDAAGHAGDTYSQLGQLFGTASSLFGMGGGMGAPRAPGANPYAGGTYGASGYPQLNAGGNFVVAPSAPGY